MTSPIDEGTAVRLTVSLLADELGRIRGRAVDAAEWSAWGLATTIDEDGVGADSLARLELVARVNQFFHLHEVGTEDYLVVRRTVGDWAEIVRETLRLRAESLTFLTSGSTGEPRRVTHRWADLSAECEGHAALLPEARRVLALTPPHHIYGFLFTALGPAMRGLPVRDMRAAAPGRAGALAEAGDVIVATPFLWALALRAGARFAPGVTGVTSGAPMDAPTWAALREAGLGRLIEIYGSTETAGVGWRDAPDADFAALAHVEAAPPGLRRRSDGVALPLQDALVWRGDRFRPAGRRDGAVQVGGVNVYPDRVRAILLEHPEVADAVVRLDASGGRLKAFVAPRAAGADLSDALRRHCADRLTAPERPARFAFGAALPVNAIGKAADWD
jgi:4-coumarate--CoA ligase (photoactive yellow protein activation family)